jgi:hypothetical protein
VEVTLLVQNPSLHIDVVVYVVTDVDVIVLVVTDVVNDVVDVCVVKDVVTCVDDVVTSVGLNLTMSFRYLLSSRPPNMYALPETADVPALPVGRVSASSLTVPSAGVNWMMSEKK